MTEQDLISKLFQFQNDYQRIPTRDEFCATVKNGHNLIKENFGTWTDFLIAAGIERKPRKIDNSIFERDIDLHLQKHEPIELVKSEPWKKTLFIGDTHFPFVHKETLNQILDFIDYAKPQVIVQVGDLYDLYSHAKFPRSHNVFTPKEESKLARSGAEEMWASIRKRAPKARLIQICGNHDIRPIKRVLESYPEAEDWIEEIIKKMMSFDGVQLISDPREELELDGNVKVIHGYYTGIGKHRDFNVSNIVCGHTHRGGVVFKQVRNEILWELNAGLCGDPSSKGLSYTAQRTIDWTLGWGWLDEYGPRFIPAKKKA